MKTIYLYHPYRATGIGGIESLIRSFAFSEELSGTKFIHVYNYNPSTTILHIEHFKRDNFSELFTPLPKNLKGKALTLARVYISSKLILNRSKAGDTIVVFHPTDMAFFNKKNLKNISLVLVQTNPFSKLLDTHFSRYTMRRLIKIISVITVYTQKDKDRLLTYYPNYSGATLIIPRGCRFNTSDKPAINSYRLVTISRIDEKQKNFSAMLDIFRKLPAEYTLDIYGDGTVAELESLKNKIKSVPRVRFMGAAKDPSLVLRNYSVFLMTSRYEGFGQTLIEARSQGLPLVAYNTFDALSWIVHDGENGFCIPLGSSDEFAAAIIKLTTNNEDYLKYSKRSLELATETAESAILQKWALIFRNNT